MRRAIAELTALFFLVGACAFRDWLNMAAAAVMALLALVEVLREQRTSTATVAPALSSQAHLPRRAQALTAEQTEAWPWARTDSTSSVPSTSDSS